MTGYVQYFVWNKTLRIIKGPFQVINQPKWKEEVLQRETQGDPSWVGGTLEQILRTPGVDRFDVARALGVAR